MRRTQLDNVRQHSISTVFGTERRKTRTSHGENRRLVSSSGRTSCCKLSCAHIFYFSQLRRPSIVITWPIEFPRSRLFYCIATYIYIYIYIYPLVSLLRHECCVRFDTVDHDILLQRLDGTYEIRGEVFKWLSAYLSGRAQAVHINGTSSPEIPLKYGVPHGSVLAPIFLCSTWANSTISLARMGYNHTDMLMTITCTPPVSQTRRHPYDFLQPDVSSRCRNGCHPTVSN